MGKFIDVSYEVRSTDWTIKDILEDMEYVDLMSFDIETRGLYNKSQREEAEKFLELDVPIETHKLASVVANNSGLSFPTVIQTTHFIFGLSEKSSVVLVTENFRQEMIVWNWLAKCRSTLIIHNTLFDLKVMYSRVGCIVKNYHDTALLTKTLINNSDSWKAKVGLKDLMGAHYDPKWSLHDEYEPEDLKSPSFLAYAATDGAATYLLYQMIMEDL